MVDTVKNSFPTFFSSDSDDENDPHMDEMNEMVEQESVNAVNSLSSGSLWRQLIPSSRVMRWNILQLLICVSMLLSPDASLDKNNESRFNISLINSL